MITKETRRKALAALRDAELRLPHPDILSSPEGDIYAGSDEGESYERGEAVADFFAERGARQALLDVADYYFNLSANDEEKYGAGDVETREDGDTLSRLREMIGRVLTDAAARMPTLEEERAVLALENPAGG